MMKISYPVYVQILEHCPTAPPETGGVLGMRDGVICAFFPDPGFLCEDRAAYIPHVQLLNRVIADWSLEGIAFCGMVHSHPTGQDSLSSGDMEYIRTVFYAMPPHIQELYFPLVLEGKEFIPLTVHWTDGVAEVRTEQITFA